MRVAGISHVSYLIEFTSEACQIKHLLWFLEITS